MCRDIASGEDALFIGSRRYRDKVHLLYVTDFVVSKSAEASSEVSAFHRLLELTAAWLGRGKEAPFDTGSLLADGLATLSTAEDGAPRRAAWSMISATETQVLRVEVTQESAPNVDLTTRVTIGDVDGSTSLRVGIARESHRSGALTPVGYTPVFQPGIVTKVAWDADLDLAVGGQSVSNQYLGVPSPYAVESLVDTLESSRRLPVLLVHTRTQGSWDFARECARKLVGLVRVVTLANASRGRLATMRPHLDVPPGGARLVWSDSHAHGPIWTEERILATSPEDMRGAVMRTVAPLSALYRGTDHVWQTARRRAQREEAKRLAARVADAQSTADQSALIAALESQVNALVVERDDAEELAERYSNEADSLRVLAELTDKAEEEAKYWRELWSEAQMAPVTVEEDDWAVVPPLVPATDPSATYRAIEKAAGQRILFTHAAATSWSKIAYPEPEDMLEKLIALANAAEDLYGEDPGSIGLIDDWFKQRHGLNTSKEDDTIKKSKGLRYFDYDGETYDQTPHVKVRDAVKPNQVGRIHFAMDSKNKRFIVNHVALKLYGI